MEYFTRSQQNNSPLPIRVADRGRLPLWLIKTAEFEMAHQITRALSREWRHFHVPASDWLNQIREPKSSATPISNQLASSPVLNGWFRTVGLFETERSQDSVPENSVFQKRQLGTVEVLSVLRSLNFGFTGCLLSHRRSSWSSLPNRDLCGIPWNQHGEVTKYRGKECLISTWWNYGF